MVSTGEPKTAPTAAPIEATLPLLERPVNEVQNTLETWHLINPETHQLREVGSGS